RPVFVVERRGPGGVSRWWIDREHHFPGKEEHFAPGDELSAVIIRSDLELDADIEDEVFEFEAPEGVDVLRDPRDWRRRVVLHTVRERLPFRAALPRVVPEGFELIDGSVAWLQGQPALHWRFYDGQRLLSVFQLRLEVPEGRFRGRQAPAPTVTQMEAGRVVGVVRDGFLFFVVGDVTTEEALEILESLEEVADCPAPPDGPAPRPFSRQCRQRRWCLRSARVQPVTSSFERGQRPMKKLSPPCATEVHHWPPQGRRLRLLAGA